MMLEAEPASPTEKDRPVAPTLVSGLALAALSGVATAVPEPGGDDVALSAIPHAGPRIAVAVLVPTVVLLTGLFGRSASRSAVLLFGVPAALGIGALSRPSAAIDPVVLAVLMATLLGYVTLALRLTLPATTGGASVVARPDDASAPRLRRRLRLYRVFPIVAALSFLLPLAAACYAIFVEGAGHPLLLLATAGLLGTLTCRAFLVDTLERHLQRDPAGVAALQRLKRHARRGRPATSFYVAAAAALLTMLAYALRAQLGLGAAA